MEGTIQVCNRCVMDETDPNIYFDENGFCNHCIEAIKKIESLRSIGEDGKEKRLVKLVKKIKEQSKGKKYDCIIGLSGGVDSSYLAYIVKKKLQLNPLAIHVDNGWNSELAVKNIENIVNKLDIDLYTYVINWNEFRDLQVAYLKASVIDLEVLSDNAIVIAIKKVMKKHGVKYFLIGHNYEAESIMASSWVYNPKYDGLNIKSIYKRFGNGIKLKTYPTLGLFGYIKYRYFNKSITENVLDLVEYNKEKAIQVLQNELNWKDYGGKHFESRITQFYQAYILPQKFNVDKRKAHLSSLIVSDQITREDALNELKKPIYDEDKLKIDYEFFLKKLKLKKEEFDTIMKQQAKNHYDYPGYNRLIKRLSKKIKGKKGEKN